MKRQLRHILRIYYLSSMDLGDLSTSRSQKISQCKTHGRLVTMKVSWNWSLWFVWEAPICGVESH